MPIGPAMDKSDKLLTDNISYNNTIVIRKFWLIIVINYRSFCMKSIIISSGVNFHDIFLL